jgi:hypothetical protein
VSANDPRLTSKLELCCRLGKGMVLIDTAVLDPTLVPLLLSDWRKCPISTIQIGRKRIGVAQSFSLIMVTKNPMPIFLPGLKSLVNVVSFAETNTGVSERLLSNIMNCNEPDVEKEAVILFERQVQLKENLFELEQNLLNSLGSANGNLLENEGLIHTLTMTKTCSNDISCALETSQTACFELDKKRSMYRGFADKCSRLYFLMSRVSEVSLMTPCFHTSTK